MGQKGSKPPSVWTKERIRARKHRMNSIVGTGLSTRDEYDLYDACVFSGDSRKVSEILDKYKMRGVNVNEIYFDNVKGPDGVKPVGAADHRGQTPLHHAAANGHTALVQLLIDTYKADVHAADDEGWTCLHSAAFGGRTEVVFMLVNKYKASPNVQTDWGFTPLHYACHRGLPDVVQTLVYSCKAKVDIKSKVCLHTKYILWDCFEDSTASFPPGRHYSVANGIDGRNCQLLEVILKLEEDSAAESRDDR
eukprot:gb/GECG01002484.1/.p1 GENE.gb/GECG01002484.1/~~gb/GECG01002484.1/.p1  ORF type:complete len:250 (+),score=20.10 gb/GECG01002484.1/:1-750(+)